MERNMVDGCSAQDQGAPPGPESGTRPSQLFTLRLWPEELGNSQVEWRGSVQHVTSGQQRYFREWPALVAAVQEMLAAHEEEP
jgi:hypothetical protein